MLMLLDDPALSRDGLRVGLQGLYASIHGYCEQAESNTIIWGMDLSCSRNGNGWE